MPGTRSTLTLWADPQCVPQARRMVADSCLDIGRGDLVENAELGVSELVTNALLHVGGSVEVRIGGTRLHPRIEVRDESTDVPVHRANGAETSRPPDAPPSIGHGLTIVARCAQAWGTDVEHDGKVVWFVPATETAAEGTAPTVTGLPPHDDDDLRPAAAALVLREVPVSVYAEFRHHFRELSREIRLLSLAGRESYPTAGELASTFRATEYLFRTDLGSDNVDRAIAAGEEYVDLELDLTADELSVLSRFRRLLDKADAFGRDAGLLTLPTSDLQGAFAQWFLGELERQHDGREPLPWLTASEARR